MNNTHPALDPDRSTLQLPKFRLPDWMRYLESFLTCADEDQIAQDMDKTHPELLQALAVFKQQGYSVEKIAGMLQGIALVQMLHYQGYIRLLPPPVRLEIDPGAKVI